MLKEISQLRKISSAYRNHYISRSLQTITFPDSNDSFTYYKGSGDLLPNETEEELKQLSEEFFQKLFFKIRSKVSELNDNINFLLNEDSLYNSLAEIDHWEINTTFNLSMSLELSYGEVKNNLTGNYILNLMELESQLFNQVKFDSHIERGSGYIFRQYLQSNPEQIFVYDEAGNKVYCWSSETRDFCHKTTICREIYNNYNIQRLHKQKDIIDKACIENSEHNIVCSIPDLPEQSEIMPTRMSFTWRSKNRWEVNISAENLL